MTTSAAFSEPFPRHGVNGGLASLGRAVTTAPPYLYFVARAVFHYLSPAGAGIPYVLNELAIARLPRATYALMLSLLPATATVVGIIVLAQVPTPIEVAGVTLVVVGVALRRPASR